MSEKLIKNWIDLAEYDFQTAKAMLDTGRYLYVVFCCQQAIEKILKANYLKEFNETPPYIHNLTKLFDKLSISKDILEDQNNFIEVLNSFYIESRYSEELQKISRLVTLEKAEYLLEKTKELFLWLKARIL